MRRHALMLVGTMAASLLAVVPMSAHADCTGVVTFNQATITFDTDGVTVLPLAEPLTVHMSEKQTTGVCDGSVGQSAFERSFTITDSDGNLVCSRDDLDPSFDPFGFGAGLHPADHGTCGADFTGSNFDPNLPTTDTPVTISKNVEFYGNVWLDGGDGDYLVGAGPVSRTVTVG